MTMPSREQTPSENADASDATAPGLRADTLAGGVVLLLTLTVGQRMVGFVRGILFCRWLPAEQLGQWDLAFSFLLLAAPLAVLGLTGSFGRYVEHYRQKGQLRSFLRRTTLVSTSLAVAGILLILFWHDSVGRLAFGNADAGPLMILLGVVLAAVVAFNYFTELFTALRQYRVVSAMQLANSLLFAAIGISLVWLWQVSVWSIVVAYGTANLITALGASLMLLRVWRSLPGCGSRLPHTRLWAKLMPFAIWVWVANLTVNLFDVADRYMIVHFSRLDVEASLALVGNYHSSRVVPVLMVAVSGMLGGLILPHLTHDWEAGRRRIVSDRLGLAVKLWTLATVAGGVAVLLASPLIFGWAFAGKYDGGLAVLPWTLTYCVWFGISLLAQNYLWCAEKARLTSLVYGVGLAVNVGLNLVLLPRLGLLGAVLATAAGNAVALALVLVLNGQLGMRVDRSVWALAALPLVLCLGPGAAAAAWIAVVWIAARGNWILRPAEKEVVIEAVGQYFASARRYLGLRRTSPA